MKSKWSKWEAPCKIVKAIQIYWEIRSGGGILEAAKISIPGRFSANAIKFWPLRLTIRICVAFADCKKEKYSCRKYWIRFTIRREHSPGINSTLDFNLCINERKIELHVTEAERIAKINIHAEKCNDWIIYRYATVSRKAEKSLHVTEGIFIAYKKSLVIGFETWSSTQIGAWKCNLPAIALLWNYDRPTNQPTD